MTSPGRSTVAGSQDDEELLDGTVTLEDYTESVDFNTGVLFDIGFGGLGAGAPGGVIFDLTFSETVEDQGRMDDSS